jgi:hypothetical protein
MIGRLLSAFARSRRHLEHDKSGGALREKQVADRVEGENP